MDAQPKVDDDARAWLDGEIAAGRLAATPSAEVLGRVAVMLTRSGDEPRVKRRRLTPAQPQAPASEVGGLKVVEETTPRRGRGGVSKAAAPRP